MSAQVTMYSTAWCGYCFRLKRHLDREGIRYSDVDIEQDPEAAELVEQFNGGNRTVPTVVIRRSPDQAPLVLTNPRLSEVRAALSPMG